MSWETVVGLEVHVQLNTRTKAFCNDLNEFGSDPNTNISPITLAHPGTLPRINKNHILAAIKLGLAFGSEIQSTNYFDRKNYFYPDLPKGYQITQDERPVCIGGNVDYIMGDGSIRSIRIHHLHMEEDAGKSIHDLSPHETYLDYNRAGVPLIEIVTEPDLRSSEEVYYFIQTLQQLVRHLGISDGNMEEGSFRCDCNVSVKKKSDAQLGERCEIKNLNSKRFAKAAVEYEALRQIRQLETGHSIVKTTMLYNPASGRTFPMRDKEEVNDYRYFADPDLPAVQITEDTITKIQAGVEETPIHTYKKLTNLKGVNHNDAMVLIDNHLLITLFDQLLKEGFEPKEIGQLIVNKIAPHKVYSIVDYSNEKNKLKRLGAFMLLIKEGKVSKSAAYNQLFEKMWDEPEKSLIEIAAKLSILKEEDQSFLKDIAKEIVHSFPDKVKAYQNGKKGLIGFFMGQAMKKSKGKADPKLLQKEIEALLKS